MKIITQTSFVRTVTDTTTGERGDQILMVNKTGAESVKGTLVSADNTTTNGVRVTTADIPNCIGVIAESGAAADALCWVWRDGSVAKVLLQDSTAATVGYWAKVSDTQNGRADITNQLPPGGTIQALEDHSSEIGHGEESATAGTNVLALAKLHFN